MEFWQLTVDAVDPPRLVRFWAHALGYQPVPPGADQLAPIGTAGPTDTATYAHYRGRLGERPAFDDRLFDPTGRRPPIWFQQVPEAKRGKNRLHLDLYPGGRDDSVPLARRIELVEATVAALVGLGAEVQRRDGSDDPDDAFHYVVLHDPEGNEFCVS